MAPGARRSQLNNQADIAVGDTLPEVAGNSFARLAAVDDMGVALVAGFEVVVAEAYLISYL